jgi:hypothetical protein
MHAIVKHLASTGFWSLYHRLPVEVCETADKYFGLLKSDPTHPSLHLKRIGELWSVRAGLHYRALGMDAPSKENSILWFWIGPHTEYDRLIKQR